MSPVDDSPRRASRSLGRRVVTWLGPVALTLAGTAWYLSTGRYVTTDNAYVKADVVNVAARVPGTVQEVRVATDATVAAGDVLVQLDDTEARLAVAQAEAALAAELNEIESLRQQVSAGQATLESARSRLDYRQREVARLAGLADRGIASRVSFDAAVEAAGVARDAVTAAERSLGELVAMLGGDPGRPAADHPRVLMRKAALEQSRVLLGYTTIRAPASGQAGTVEVFPGEQVRAGEILMSLVAMARPWVEANLKETQVGHLQIGQPATVEIDAYPGAVWTARVASLGPATGAEFALIPPENASGNWVKIVQRLPVRLEFESEGPVMPLRSGMSAEVRIDTGEANRRIRRWVSARQPDLP